MQLSKPLLLLATLGWFAAGIWWYSGSTCSSCNTATATTVTPAPTQNISLPGFSVADGAWNLSTPGNLRFGRSNIVPVFGNDMPDILNRLVAYNKSNPEKVLTVTGHYKADETNNTTFGNLGLARADALKVWLISKGLSEKNINTASQLDDGLVFSPADTLVGGITMAFNGAAPALPVKEDLFTPRTIYFNTGRNSLPVNAEFTSYIEQVKNYLQNNPDKKLVVTGHTDNAGNADKNLQLSAERAAFIKSELAKKGIAETRIESAGKGMNEPVADNGTPAGKAKNRRVTIQLQ
jgi:OmpA-OmpF porin, OOP family